MPGIVREGDVHVGHASPTPNPFHQTPYVASNNSTVFINNRLAIVKGDTTACGDPAVGASGDVFIGGIAVHRLGDATGGHGTWSGNAAATASGDVIING
jgi:uncharacterized Zn-binding protein involved in type VI secretion